MDNADNQYRNHRGDSTIKPSQLSPYSVLLTVYKGDDPEEFERALLSCLEQTYPPDEVLIVSDGPLTASLLEKIEEYKKDRPETVNHLDLPRNRGRGAAAREGVKASRNALIGIMAADDICRSERFEQQITFLDSNSEVDVLGGNIAEFTASPDEVETIREVPTDPSEIHRMAKFRNPMNEVSVVFRSEAVLSAGNYRDVDRMEDYDLWVRLLQDGATLANLDTVLVDVSGGDQMFSRRGGVEYAREEFRQQYSFLQSGFVSLPRFLLNLCLRVPIRLMPNRLRSWVYRRYTRTG